MTAAPSLNLNSLSPSSYYYLLKAVTDINSHVKKEETEEKEKKTCSSSRLISIGLDPINRSSSIFNLETSEVNLQPQLTLFLHFLSLLVQILHSPFPLLFWEI